MGQLAGVRGIFGGFGRTDIRKFGRIRDLGIKRDIKGIWDDQEIWHD